MFVNRLLICDFHFSFRRSTLNIDFWFCVLTFSGHCRPPKLTGGERSEKCHECCRERIEIAVSKLKLPWTIWAPLGSEGGAVVRALASHQCCPGSNPSVAAICGLNLLLVVSLAPRGFSPDTRVFPSPQKPTFPNSNSTRNQVDEEPLCVCLQIVIYLLYLFIIYLALQSFFSICSF